MRPRDSTDSSEQRPPGCLKERRVANTVFAIKSALNKPTRCSLATRTANKFDVKQNPQRLFLRNTVFHAHTYNVFQKAQLEYKQRRVTCKHGGVECAAGIDNFAANENRPKRTRCIDQSRFARGCKAPRARSTAHRGNCTNKTAENARSCCPRGTRVGAPGGLKVPKLAPPLKRQTLWSCGKIWGNNHDVSTRLGRNRRRGPYRWLHVCLQTLPALPDKTSKLGGRHLSAPQRPAKTTRGTECSTASTVPPAQRTAKKWSCRRPYGELAFVKPLPRTRAASGTDSLSAGRKAPALLAKSSALLPHPFSLQPGRAVSVRLALSKTAPWSRGALSCLAALSAADAGESWEQIAVAAGSLEAAMLPSCYGTSERPQKDLGTTSFRSWPAACFAAAHAFATAALRILTPLAVGTHWRPEPSHNPMFLPNHSVDWWLCQWLLLSKRRPGLAPSRAAGPLDVWPPMGYLQTSGWLIFPLQLRFQNFEAPGGVTQNLQYRSCLVVSPCFCRNTENDALRV